VTLSNVTVEYGQKGVDLSANTYACTVSIADSTFSNISGNGIYIYGESGSTITLNVSNNTVSDTDGYGIYTNMTGSSTHLDGSIQENTVTASGTYGIYLLTQSNALSTVSVKDNTVTSSSTYGIYLQSSYTSTNKSEIEVTGNDVYEVGTTSNHYGIYCNASYSDMAVQIYDNEVHDNAGKGIYCYQNGSYTLYPEISNNLVYFNSGDGINCNGSYLEPVITLNTVRENGGHGIYCNASNTAKILFNNIYLNSDFDLANGSANSIDARSCFWGNNTTAEMISAGDFADISKIYDIFDNSTKGMVNYTRWMTSEIDTSPDRLSIIIDPYSGATLNEGEVTISGIAYATEGIDRIQVSMDNGVSWQNAWVNDTHMGKTLWHYTIDEIYNGTYSVRCRVVDRNDVTESPGDEVSFTIDSNEPTRSGTLVSDETWSGTVELQGDLIVPQGVTLTVLPGTTVEFPQFFDITLGGDDNSKSELIVHGSLLAEGESGNPIVFTSHAAGSAQKGDWVGIYVAGDIRLQYATVEYAEYGIKAEFNEDLNNLIISDSTIQHNAGHGIDIYAGGNANIQADIQDSVITNNDGTGIVCRAYTGTTTVSASFLGNEISNNGIYGIYCFSDGGSGSPVITASIDSNTIYGHTTYGIYGYTTNSATSDFEINNNTIYQSGTGIYANYSHAGLDCILNIYNNTAHNGVQGLEINTYYTNITPSIQDNIIYDHASDGLQCSFTGADTYTLAPQIQGNQVYENAGNGIYLKVTQPITLTNNGMYDNADYDLYNDYTVDITATGNWWGTETTSEMVNASNPTDIIKIYDAYDDAGKGTVDYADWLLLFDVPNAPGLDPVTSPTGQTSQQISGTKDAGTSVFLNGAEIVPADGNTTWTYDLPLSEGNNAIVLFCRNADQMASATVSSAIVRDTVAPDVYSSVPADNGYVRRIVDIIDITLLEEGTAIDPVATLANATVQDGGGPVSGQWDIDYNHVTFTPDLPLGAGTYSVTFYPTDTPLGNTRTKTISFTVDLSAPATPTLNEVLSPTRVTPQTLSGSKEAGTSIWLDNSQIVPVDELTSWSYSLALTEGDNACRLYARDQAGNPSEDILFTIVLDRAPPVFQNSVPANGSFVMTSPATIALYFTDATTSLDEQVSIDTASLKDSSNQVVLGTWALQVPDTIVFTPASTLNEDSYTASVRAYDLAGNSVLTTISFTYDITAPATPTLNPVQSPTSFAVQTLSGTKEAYSSIWINGVQVVPVDANTEWSYQISLNEGINSLEIYSKDAAGNQSGSVMATIEYDETAPLPVSNLTADGSGIGTTVTLDWTGYDEAIQGDIDYYRVYAQDYLFTQISSMTPVMTVPAGTFGCMVENLTKGTLYYFAVVAVDTKGNALTSVTPVSATPTDTTPPEDVTDVQVQSFDTSLTFTWTASADTYGDLAGYKVYFNGATVPDPIASGVTTYPRTGLNPASAYPFKITAYDSDGNESSGVTLTAITLLQNPANVSATPHGGYVTVAWDASEPQEYVKHYAIYVSDADFTTVEGMTPVQTIRATSCNISGLTNHQTYYFAVTAVNLSGGEQKTVSTVAATPGTEILSIQGNYISPVSAVNNYRLTIQFSGSMDTATQPVVQMVSTGSAQPSVPTGGTWLTTAYSNDTYVTPDVVLSQGMDGQIQVNISGAKDSQGIEMAIALNAYEFILDATPPPAPVISQVITTCDSALVSWSGYTPIPDLAGFEIYAKPDADFTTIEGLSPVGWVNQNGRSYNISGLLMGSHYYVAVVAVDTVGNKILEVTPEDVFIDIVIPSPVDIQVSPGDDPDAALVSWQSYDTSGQCGLAGFNVYYQTSDFTSVTGLTPKAIIDAGDREYLIRGLDRSQTYFIAVVGFNSSGVFNADVVTVPWSDPYAGIISEDLTIGDGEQKEIEIFQFMTVTSGATLTVMPGTSLKFISQAGIEVQSGALLIQGTALDPVILTSANDRDGMTPSPGDWNGITIGSDGSSSILNHVFIKYGKGLTLNTCTPQIQALTVTNNSTYGLGLFNSASANTSEALIVYNGKGIQCETGSSLNINNSVIKYNADDNVNEDSSGSVTAENNWWGTTDPATIASSVLGTVDTDPFMTFEPLLTPAMGTLDGETNVGTRDVTLKLACRTAEEMRISEDSTFENVFFDAFSDTFAFTLSQGGGVKTIFAQFKSATGTVSDPISIQITYVAEGPVIQTFSLSEGQTISRPLTVTGQATAPLGMDKIEFYVDDDLVEQAYGNSLTFRWDVRTLENRIHRVKLVARDLYNNFAVSEKNVTISATPPPPPAITVPSDGLVVSSGPVTVHGTAEPYITVHVTSNGFVAGTTDAGEDGSFEVTDVALTEGSNEMIATATDDIGVSANSNRVTIILDSGAPAAPVLMDPTVIVGSGVLLNWKYAEEGEHPSFFRIYRSNSTFSDTSQASLIKDFQYDLNYLDTQAPDGSLYYAVVGVDGAGNTSLMSNVVMIDYDSMGPVFAILYDKTPPFGVGDVNITLTTTETLDRTPTLTITPPGSSGPDTVLLSGSDDYTYTGTYAVTAGMGSGEAQVFVSGRDITGNTFSGTPSGASFIIDTQGPSGMVTTDLSAPVQVLAPKDMNMTLTLSEPPATGTPPTLGFTPPVGDDVIIVLTGSDNTWTGTLQLTPAMGTGNGCFSMQAQDELGNAGTQISSGEYLEIYNTALAPAPPEPVGLTATSQPAGAIDLSWSSVALAESYRIYRSDGDCASTPAEVVVSGLTTTEFTDTPPSDGTYCYGVTANRLGSESGMSDTVEVLSDATPPGPPENVTAALGTSGVVIAWQAPSSGEPPARYFVYRNGLIFRTTTDSFSVMDYPAGGGTYEYVVSSSDDIGNENLSNPVTFNLTVGAVSNLEATLSHGNVPELTWESSDPNVVGFNVYKGGIKLNPDPISDTAYKDVYYAGSSMVQYEIRAVDENEVESPPRTVQVFPLTLNAIANPDENGDPRPLMYNYFDEFQIAVNNRDTSHTFPLDHLQLQMTADGSVIFDQEKTVNQAIPESDPYLETAVIPCGTTVEDHVLLVSAVQAENNGSSVVYERAFTFTEITRQGVAVELSSDSLPLAGGIANINVCIQNQGMAAMDIVVSRGNGAEPGDIYVAIVNAENLEISRSWYQGFPPGSMILPDGTAYITLGAGESLCVEVPVLVPESLEEDDVITFEGGVDEIYHNYGTDDPLTCDGLSGSLNSGITLTEYYGTAQADKDVYSDDETIVISGQAIDRETSLPKPNVDLKIGFFTRGFHWFQEVTTDGDGNYTYEYQPTLGLSGQFTVWAAHPDVFDIINQDGFELFRIYAKPSRGDIRMSKADTINFSIELYNPGEVPLTDFSWSFRAYTIDENENEIDEPTLTGQVNYGQDFVIEPGETKPVALELTAAMEAPDTANAEYTFISSQGACVTFTGVVSLLPAVPLISVESPASGYVDVSIDRGSMLTTSVTLVNKGLKDLLDVELVPPAQISWMTTNLPADEQGKFMIGDIPVGGTKTVDVVFIPPNDTEFGYHQDKIILKGTNSELEFEVNLYAMVTSNLKGSVQFFVSNILGQEVEDATVRMRNADIREEITPVKTDANGELLVADLQEGEWSWQVVAPGHTTTAGSVTVVADQVVLVEPLLSRNLVTVDFSVEPVPFTDQYEITIEQTFETHVPVPVLIVDPPYFEFEGVKPGFEANLMIRAKNEGLININDLTIESTVTSWGTFEPLITYMPELRAMEEIYIPYRATYFGEESAPSEQPLAESLSSPRSSSADEFVECMADHYSGYAKYIKAMKSYWNGHSDCPRAFNSEQSNFQVVNWTMVAYKFYPFSFMMNPIDYLPPIVWCVVEQIGCGIDWPDTETGSPFLLPLPWSPPDRNPICFAAKTRITMADGSIKPIQDITAGDRVMAFNGKPNRVKQVYSRMSDHIREIWYRNQTGDVKRLETTDGHLFWVNGKEWIPARKLKTGDFLMTKDKEAYTIERNERFSKPVRVYNFDVDRFRSYFAGDILVHERCGVTEEDPAQKEFSGSTHTGVIKKQKEGLKK